MDLFTCMQCHQEQRACETDTQHSHVRPLDTVGHKSTIVPSLVQIETMCLLWGALCAFRAERYTALSRTPLFGPKEGHRQTRLAYCISTHSLSHVRPCPRQRCGHHASVVLLTSSGHPARHRAALDFNSPIVRLFWIMTMPNPIKCYKTSHNNATKGSKPLLNHAKIYCFIVLSSDATAKFLTAWSLRWMATKISLPSLSLYRTVIILLAERIVWKQRARSRLKMKEE